MRHIFGIVLWAILTASSFAATVRVFFSPDGGCTEALVKEIEGAQNEILVQAYSFTSESIATALIDAKKRGVVVEVILDKSNEREGSEGKVIAMAGIPVWIDYLSAIAHSKVMIIDRKTVISGSFNFTQSAEHRNVENLLLIKRAPSLVGKYVDEFDLRKRVSRPLPL